jgi:hypothetical protein
MTPLTLHREHAEGGQIRHFGGLYRHPGRWDSGMSATAAARQNIYLYRGGTVTFPNSGGHAHGTTHDDVVVPRRPLPTLARSWQQSYQGPQPDRHARLLPSQPTARGTAHGGTDTGGSIR